MKQNQKETLAGVIFALLLLWALYSAGNTVGRLFGNIEPMSFLGVMLREAVPAVALFALMLEAFRHRTPPRLGMLWAVLYLGLAAWSFVSICSAAITMGSAVAVVTPLLLLLVRTALFCLAFFGLMRRTEAEVQKAQADDREAELASLREKGILTEEEYRSLIGKKGE